MANPTWEVSSTFNTVTVDVINPGSYSYFSYSLRDAFNNILSGPTSYSTSRSHTFSGLDPQTSYIVYLSWSTSTVGEGNYDSTTVITSFAIDLWSWTSSNGNATATQTRNAYTAISSNGYLRNFSYLVWNDMVNKVWSILINTGDSWNSRYCTYAETCMLSDDRTLTADRFNSLRHNIGLHVSTGITERSPGDRVRGSYFITLADCINEWINSL